MWSRQCPAAQTRDCGPRAQAADRALAIRADGSPARGGCPENGTTESIRTESVAVLVPCTGQWEARRTLGQPGGTVCCGERLVIEPVSLAEPCWRGGRSPLASPSAAERIGDWVFG